MIVLGFSTTCVISAITAEVEILNPACGEMYPIQHYVIRFVSDLPQDIPVSSTSKTERHDITEILLKVALSTITLTLPDGK